MTRLLQAMAGGRHGGAEGFFTCLVLAPERDGQTQRVVIRPRLRGADASRAGGVAVSELPSSMNRASALMPRGHFVRLARLGGYYDLKYYRAFFEGVAA